jgi:endonuclease/exonuclease/phosphatase family metal-dependent hydrolase
MQAVSMRGCEWSATMSSLSQGRGIARASTDSMQDARASEATAEGPKARLMRVRLVTYNVHGCVGTDGRLSTSRIAETIAALAPDIVALQELDVARARSRREDQPAMIAERLGMEAHFSPSVVVGDERYGNAILSRLPLRLQKAGTLPTPAGREPRGAIWGTVSLGGVELQIINTHFGLDRRERLTQALALLGERWIGHPDFSGPSVVCGDLNALPLGRACRLLAASLRDASRKTRLPVGQGTFPSRWPVLRIDHIFVGGPVRVEETRVLSTPLARVASDHLPLLAALVLPW